MSSDTQHAGHPDWEALWAHHLETDPAIESHVAGCETCCDELVRIAMLSSAMSDARAFTPTADTIERSLAFLRAETSRPDRTTLRELAIRALSSLSEAAREVAAALVRDSLQPALNLRGSGVATPRMLVYETPDLVISINLTRSADGSTTIDGQLVPRSGASIEPGGLVSVEGDGQSLEAPIGELGRFRLADLPAGVRSLRLRIGDQSVLVNVPSEGGS